MQLHIRTSTERFPGLLTATAMRVYLLLLLGATFLAIATLTAIDALGATYVLANVTLGAVSSEQLYASTMNKSSLRHSARSMLQTPTSARCYSP